MAKEKAKVFVGPKSICLCGHTGDGEHSDHADVGRHPTGAGKAGCLVNGCRCQRFTWKQWTKKCKRFLKSRRRGERWA
jgi:hypothetical protein